MGFNLKLIGACCLTVVGLSACGGSSSSADNNGVTPPVVIPPPTPNPVPNVADPLFPPNTNVTSCAGLDFIHLISAEATGTEAAGFEAAKAIDNDLSETSRWETATNRAQLTIELGYRHYVKEIGTAWFEGSSNINTFDVSISEDGITFSTVLTNETTSGKSDSFVRFGITPTVARFVRITSFGGSTNNITALAEVAVFGCPLDVAIAPLQSTNVDLSQYNLDSSVPPGNNFDLLSWALDTPREDPDDGLSTRTSERALDNGFEDTDYFYTADDGGMVFVATIFGAKTSANTAYTRSELREMLRRGNTSISTTGVNQNNWILGYQPDPQRTVGGRGGELKATLKIDKTTTTGSQPHQGRVIVGQIHADNDEPIRLYFKKFPNNERGYLYFGHEIRDSDDIWKMVVGRTHTNDDNQPIYTDNPEQGIALGEVFSYEINQQGSRIDVIIRRGDLSGPIIGHQYVDMTLENSGYDIAEEWNYFKAGAYSQNNTGNSGDVNGVGSDYDKVTFYYLNNTHGPQ